jgi:choline kinase
MRAVMLAAGDGGRLGRHTAELPKPLVPIAGRPIVEYTLDALAAAGVREAVVVTGYRESQVRAALGDGGEFGLRLSFVSNPRFHGGASLSLKTAREACGDESFLLVMSDHLLSEGLVRRLLEGGRGTAAEGHCRVAADFGYREQAYVDEATKLAVAKDGRVLAIGKGLVGWAALDTGAFLLTPEVWAAAEAVADECELSIIFGELARRGKLFATDVSGCFWYDVDTNVDLEVAAALLPGGGSAG